MTITRIHSTVHSSDRVEPANRVERDSTKTFRTFIRRIKDKTNLHVFSNFSSGVKRSTAIATKETVRKF